MKRIIGVYRNQQMHWVGDGFPVKNLFSYDRLGQAISPFLLLDYAAPYHFNPTTAQHGVGSHPHRGFETVTIAYKGEVTHMPHRSEHTKNISEHATIGNWWTSSPMKGSLA